MEIEKSQNATLFAALLGLDAARVWDTELAFEHLRALGAADTKRTAERKLNGSGILPDELSELGLLDEGGRSPNRLVLKSAVEEARKRRYRVLFAQMKPLSGGQPCLHANDARGARFWVPLNSADDKAVWSALVALQRHIGKPIAVFPHDVLVGKLRDMDCTPEIRLCSQAYQPVLPPGMSLTGSARPRMSPSRHLKRLEAESIHIIREAVAEARNPVMVYDMGKEGSVMLHLARKAFFPASPPFPLLHIDSRWEFQEMYLFRDLVARESGMSLLVHSNPDGIDKNINPFEHGRALHIAITKTDALAQAVGHHGFDTVFVGARRDEDGSLAQEGAFALRSETSCPAPINLRPELWNLYNTHKNPGESIRVHPLSNWTELDIWQYVYSESITVVPLYFARPRAVVVRPGTMMMVDDERCRLLPGEKIEIRKVRFRSISCYPLSGAVESEAETPAEILLEMIGASGAGRPERRMNVCGEVAMSANKHEEGF